MIINYADGTALQTIHEFGGNPFEGRQKWIYLGTACFESIEYDMAYDPLQSTINVRYGSGERDYAFPNSSDARKHLFALRAAYKEASNRALDLKPYILELLRDFEKEIAAINELDGQLEFRDIELGQKYDANSREVKERLALCWDACRHIPNDDLTPEIFLHVVRALTEARKQARTRFEFDVRLVPDNDIPAFGAYVAGQEVEAVPEIRINFNALLWVCAEHGMNWGEELSDTVVHELLHLVEHKFGLAFDELRIEESIEKARRVLDVMVPGHGEEKIPVKEDGCTCTWIKGTSGYWDGCDGCPLHGAE